MEHDDDSMERRERMMRVLRRFSNRHPELRAELSEDGNLMEVKEA